MRGSKLNAPVRHVVAALGMAAGFLLPALGQAETYGFGKTATPEEIQGWSITVFPDGKNFPPGSGTVANGRKIYEAQCVACHGAKGEGGLGDRLVGGAGTLNTDKPVKTVGSYWPYAPTLFDYIRRAMPLMAPQTLTNEEAYAVTGYVLYLNDLVKEDATIDAKTLTDLQMPNRHGFIADPRPDVHTKGTTAMK